MAEKLEKIEIRYERSLDFKTIYADGVFGGPTSTGQLRLEFFVSLPKAHDVEIAPVKENVLQNEIEKVGAEPGVVIREKQVCVIMSPDTAKVLLDWLKAKVGLFG